MDTQIQTDAFSEDLLKSFRSSLDSESRIGSGEEEVELTLGLSLNGRFGVDPMAPKLARSSSIPEYMNPSAPRDTSAVAVAVAAAATAARHVFPAVASGSLKRTCSLPVEPEEEVRKRKEMQSFRRMEAKRKRTEKQRNLILRAAAKDSIDRKGSIPVPLKMEKRVSKGSSSEKLRNHSQGPVVSSQGSSSDPESQIIEGMSRSGAELSPETKGQTLSDQMESEANSEAGLVRWPSLGTGMKNQFNKLSVSDNSPVSMDMPCVSTQGDGPEGKRIKGFLYRYSRSEEVRIVCFCHGSFLSPAEFVQHAGGTDVEKPLKHIVVTPSAFSI